MVMPVEQQLQEVHWGEVVAEEVLEVQEHQVGLSLMQVFLLVMVVMEAWGFKMTFRLVQTNITGEVLEVREQLRIIRMVEVGGMELVLWVMVEAAMV